MKTVKKVSKTVKNSQKVGHKKFVICLQKVLKTYFSCFANIVLGVCSIVCVLSLDPFFSCVFRLNVDDVNVIFLSIFFHFSDCNLRSGIGCGCRLSLGVLGFGCRRDRRLWGCLLWWSLILASLQFFGGRFDLLRDGVGVSFFTCRMILVLAAQICALLIRFL